MSDGAMFKMWICVFSACIAGMMLVDIIFDR